MGRKVALLFTFLVALWLSGVAQEVGRLRGTVKNAKGQPIALEVVTATHLATGKTLRALTQKDGSYLFPQMAPGVWRLEVNVRDYFRAKRDGVLIVAGKEAVVDFVLYPLVQLPVERPLGHAGPSPLTAPTPEQDFALSLTDGDWAFLASAVTLTVLAKSQRYGVLPATLIGKMCSRAITRWLGKTTSSTSPLLRRR